MKNASSILFAVAVWSLLILRFGYRYGTGDQVELLPYVLFLHDHSLYLHDFFIQGLHASIPNERTMMATLLLPFVNHMEIMCFVLHFISTVLLVLGLEKIAVQFTQNKYVAWLAVLLALIPLNDYTLGNVELHSDCFQASLLSVATVVWGIHFFLKEKYTLTSVLMSVATFVQLLDGLDVMLVLSALLFLRVILKQITVKTFLCFLLIYGLTAGIYLVLILEQKSGATNISNEQLFSILFEFRHPHHFIFTSFPPIKTIVFCSLAIPAVIFFSKRNRVIFHFILLATAGIAFYAVAVDVFHFIPIANFQFYKISPWIKFLGIVALMAFVENKLPLLWSKISNLKFEKHLLVLSALVSWVVVVFFHQLLPYKVPFQIFSLKHSDDMISICEKIKNKIPHNAVFVQPFDNTELKFYGQQSSYVEFKANVRNKLFVEQWADRIQEVFGVHPGMEKSGFTLSEQADSFYYSLSAEQLQAIKQKGVTHLLLPTDDKPALGDLILSNKSYAVYQL